MHKSIYLFTLIFLLNQILCLTPCSNSSNISQGFINKENDLLILNNRYDKKELIIYKKDELNQYQIKSTINLIELPLNDSNESSTDFDINTSYHVISYFSTKIEFVFFNEKYFFSSIIPKEELYNKNKKFSYIGNNSFAYLDENIVTFSIVIIQFDLKLNDTNKYHIIQRIPIQAKILISLNKNIECKALKESKYFVCITGEKLVAFAYSLIIFDSNYNLIYDKKMYEKTEKEAMDEMDLTSQLFEKIIPLNDKKFIICFTTSKNSVKLGLVEIESDSNIKITMEEDKDLINSITPEINSELVINDNNIILGFKEIGKYNEKLLKIVNITIVNDKLEKDFIDFDFYSNSKIPNLRSIKFLEDNKGDVLFLMNYNSSGIIKNVFHDFGYSICNDLTTKVYNGEKTRFIFNNTLIPRFNTRENSNNYNIIFSFDENLTSLIDDNNKKIESGNIYNKNNIYFKLDTNNYEYITENGEYRVIYYTNIDEQKSQRCKLKIEFYPCASPCELCSHDNKCYDKYWNIIEQTKEENEYKESRSSFIFTVVIFMIIFIIIMLIAFVFLCKYCCKSNNNVPIENYNQDQIPIINEYNYPIIQNQYNNNNNYNNNNYNYNQPQITVNPNGYPNMKPSSYENNSYPAAPYSQAP